MCSGAGSSSGGSPSRRHSFSPRSLTPHHSSSSHRHSSPHHCNPNRSSSEHSADGSAVGGSSGGSSSVPSPGSGTDDATSLDRTRYGRFEILGSKVRCRAPNGKRIKLTSLGSVEWFQELDPERPSKRALSMVDYGVVLESVQEWTQFFMKEKKIRLSGMYKCANGLSSRNEQNVIEVMADIMFPYYRYQDLTVRGESRGGNLLAEKIHLDPNYEKIVLQRKQLYLIGGDSESGSFGSLDYCRLCRTRHNILHTPCPKAMHFIATGDVKDIKNIKKKLTPCCSGLRVLCVRPNGETWFDSSPPCERLCSICEESAENEKNVWFKLDNTCENEGCINEEFFCMDDVPGCQHYVYISRGVVHNLSSFEIPRAVEEGRLRAVVGAAYSRLGVRLYANCATGMVCRAAVKKEKITVEDLVELLGGSVPELLTIAMYDRRLADCIDGNKSITINETKGTAENAEAIEVGPWLVGRIVDGVDGKTWHIPMGIPITIRTRDSISHISKWHESDGPSDRLGRFVG